MAHTSIIDRMCFKNWNVLSTGMEADNPIVDGFNIFNASFYLFPINRIGRYNIY